MSSAAVAQRRQRQVHDVEPVEEVLAEPPGVDLAARSRLVPAMMRTSTGCGRVAADGPHCLSSITRSSFDLERHGQLADLVEEERAAVRRRRRGPWFACTAPVKAPRTWPKSSLSSRVSGMAPQFTATKRPSRRGLAGVDGARDQLLAGAALAGDQHVAGGGRAPGDLLPHRRIESLSPDEQVLARERGADARGRAALLVPGRAGGGAARSARGRRRTKGFSR